MIINVIFRILRDFHLDILLPLMFVLKIIRILLSIGLISTTVTLIIVIICTACVGYYGKSKPWIITTYFHIVVFVSITVPRLSMTDKINNLFDAYDLLDFVIAANLLISIIDVKFIHGIMNKFNGSYLDKSQIIYEIRKVIGLINIICYAIILLFFVHHKNYEKSFNILTEIITVSTIFLVHSVEKQRLYNVIMRELTIETILYVAKSVYDFENCKEFLCNNLSGEALSNSMSGLIDYLSTPSDVPLIENIKYIREIVIYTKQWVVSTVPPIVIQCIIVCLSYAQSVICFILYVIFVNVPGLKTSIVLVSICCHAIKYIWLLKKSVLNVRPTHLKTSFLTDVI